MTLIETVVASLLSSGVLVALVIFLTKTWISERLKNAIKSEYDLKLEEYKAKLEIAFNDQVKRRQLYDEFSGFIEEAFGSGQLKTKADLSLALNRLFGKLALYGPDDVYLKLKDALIDRGIVSGKDVKPQIYCALRKSLWGDSTKLKAGDFVPHIGAEHIPEQEAQGSTTS